VQEIPIEIEAGRSLERPARDSVVPATRGSMQSRVDRLEPAPAYSTRRPQSAVSVSVSSASRDAHLPPVRDRIQFPAAPSDPPDTDWDTPAYQRRQSG